MIVTETATIFCTAGDIDTGAVRRHRAAPPPVTRGASSRNIIIMDLHFYVPVRSSKRVCVRGSRRAKCPAGFTWRKSCQCQRLLGQGAGAGKHMFGYHASRACKLHQFTQVAWHKARKGHIDFSRGQHAAHRSLSDPNSKSQRGRHERLDPHARRGRRRQKQLIGTGSSSLRMTEYFMNRSCTKTRTAWSKWSKRESENLDSISLFFGFLEVQVLPPPLCRPLDVDPLWDAWDSLPPRWGSTLWSSSSTKNIWSGGLSGVLYVR